MRQPADAHIRIKSLFSRFRILLAFFLFLLIVVWNPQLAMAGLHLGISGTAATNHLGRQTQKVQAGKGSLAVDLGSYFRLSYSFQAKLQSREGQLESSEVDGEYIDFKEEINQTGHSIDLFVILYAGELFTPFVFVGGALKHYRIYYEEEGEEPTEVEGPLPGYNYGAGFAISLNRSFSLKITNTWSPGVTINKAGEERDIRDVQTDVGINYHLR